MNLPPNARQVAISLKFSSNLESGAWEWKFAVKIYRLWWMSRDYRRVRKLHVISW